MSKKIFSRHHGKMDLLVAEPGVEGFVSLKTGERYDEAVVSYKAALFTPNALVERAKGHGIEIGLPCAEYTLTHIVRFKTGARVRHTVSNDQAIRFIEL